jgi:hypothetical protein
MFVRVGFDLGWGVSVDVSGLVRNGRGVCGAFRRRVLSLNLIGGDILPGAMFRNGTVRSLRIRGGRFP